MSRASSRVRYSGPGCCSLCTLRRRPCASRASISRSYASCDTRYCGSRLLSVQVSTTSPGRAKQHRLSTWPSVSSSTTPLPSQMTLLDAEILVQQDFELARVQVRIAIRIQQALLGRDQRAFAVDVDRAAFEHERRAIAVAAFDLQHLARNEIVLVPRESTGRR